MGPRQRPQPSTAAVAATSVAVVRSPKARNVPSSMMLIRRSRASSVPVTLSMRPQSWTVSIPVSDTTRGGRSKVRQAS